MTLSNSEFRNQWKQVPDQYIWYNKSTGIFVSVNGTSDNGWAVARRTIPLSKDGGFGSVVTENISPYYVSVNKQPVGQQATMSNINVKENEDWRPGTFNDAVYAAYEYMYNYNNNIKKR